MSTRALVELDRSFYSVPHAHVGQRVRVRIAVDSPTLEVHAAEGIVAVHQIASQPGSIVWDRRHREAIDRELTGRHRTRSHLHVVDPTPTDHDQIKAGPVALPAGTRRRPDRSGRPLPPRPEGGGVMATTSTLPADTPASRAGRTPSCLPCSSPKRPRRPATGGSLPGCGKTHLAVALATCAVEAGYRGYFTSTADLCATIAAAYVDGTFATKIRTYTGPSVLVIDDVGLTPLDRAAGNAMFPVVNRRYSKGSATNVTTNRGLTEWGGLFGDAVVASAIIDRLLHNAIVFNIKGPSWRLREHQALIDRTTKGSSTVT